MSAIINDVLSILPSAVYILIGSILGSVIYHSTNARKKLKIYSNLVQDQETEIELLQTQNRICFNAIEFLHNQLTKNKSEKDTKQKPIIAQPIHNFSTSPNFNQEKRSATQ